MNPKLIEQGQKGAVDLHRMTNNMEMKKKPHYLKKKINM